MTRIAQLSLRPFSNRTLILLTVLFAASGQAFLIQAGTPWTSWMGVLFYALAAIPLWLIFSSPPSQVTLSDFSVRLEGFWFCAILLLGLFMRFYRLHEFPAGIFSDEGCEGWGALRLLHTSWRPQIDDQSLSVINPSIYYFLAAWFNFFPATQLGLFGASVFLGLAAFPFCYWVFRQWAGPRTALVALFLIAVMRWHLTYSRDAHPAIEIFIYMMATLGFWLHAHRTGKTWAFALSGLFCGLGIYSYQDYRIFPVLMGVYAAYELFHAGKDPKRKLAGVSVFAVTAMLVAEPFVIHLLRRGTLDHRTEELMAFPGVYRRGGLWGVLEHFQSGWAAFNRRGDSWFIHNIPDHRLLDDVTGVLLILGLFYALSRIRQRGSFYALVGFFFMCLPAWLSIDPGHASRLFGTIPFIAFLCADVLEALVHRLFPPSPPGKGRRAVILGLILTACAVQNFHQYFGLQAHNESCWTAQEGAVSSWIGRCISKDRSASLYWLSSRFYGEYTVNFLAYGQRDSLLPLVPSSCLGLPGLPPDKAAYLFFDQGQTGVLDIFKSLYPGGHEEIFQNPDGVPLGFSYRISPEEAARGHAALARHPFSHGLLGTYQTTGIPNAPSLVRIDPVLNFTFREDFPHIPFPPLWAQWRGNLEIPKTGEYRFLILTSDEAGLFVDGKRLLQSGNKDSTPLRLSEGDHSIWVVFRKLSGTDTMLNLLWETPRSPGFRLVPSQALYPPGTGKSLARLGELHSPR